jgi:hypothetical protein
MTESICTYSGNREEALVASLYDDGDPVLRAAFDAHLAACGRCRDELDALRGVRAQLGLWAPPEPSFALFSHPPSAIRNPPSSWWRQIPAWAQVAAALLFLGVSAGVANLDVRYDANGLSVRTGWSKRPPAPAATVAQGDGASAPWRADLAALERQMKTEFRAAQVSATRASATHVSAAPVAATVPRAASAADADVLRRVRALLDQSEKRQQNEMALRVAEVLRDVGAQRQADLVKIDRSLGVVQNNLGVEVMKQRQSLNLLYRASQRQ